MSRHGPRTAYQEAQEERIAALTLRYSQILDKADGKRPKRPTPRKPIRFRVLCVETGNKFRKIKDAALWAGRTRNAVRCAMDRGTTCGGYHFRDLKFPATWPTLKPPRDKAVICLDAQVTYPSGYIAAKRLLGTENRFGQLHAAAMAIYRACKTGQPALGMRWRRA